VKWYYEVYKDNEGDYAIGEDHSTPEAIWRQRPNAVSALSFDSEGKVEQILRPVPTYLITWDVDLLLNEVHSEALHKTRPAAALSAYEWAEKSDVENLRILRSTDSGYEYITESELREAAK
jgi:hypothetical protein